MTLSEQTFSYMCAVRKEGTSTITRGRAKAIAQELGFKEPQWLIGSDLFKVGRGLFSVPTDEQLQTLNLGYPAVGETARRVPAPAVKVTRARKTKTKTVVPSVSTIVIASQVTANANTEFQSEVSKALGVDILLEQEAVPYVPDVLKTYVPWGHFDTLQTIIESRHFLPTMVVGPSGNGKTEMYEQICARLGREYVRVNITNQTDEDDLLGGFRLVNGETKFALGPIPVAMLRGAFVNLDEIDLGGAALMCLQPVLEGKPLFLKKIGRYIHAAAGFGVGATANTKGRGDDGRHAHTTIMNDAMLERFAAMLEQGWAPVEVERVIVRNILKTFGTTDNLLVRHLVEFAAATRVNFTEQRCNDQIATRRLVHFCKLYASLKNDAALAMKLTLQRFDEESQIGFTNLWEAIHGAPEVGPSGQPVDAPTT